MVFHNELQKKKNKVHWKDYLLGTKQNSQKENCATFGMLYRLVFSLMSRKLRMLLIWWKVNESICLSFLQFVSLSISVCVSLFFYLSIYQRLSVFLSVFLLVGLSICLYINLNLSCLFISVSVCLSVYLSVHPSAVNTWWYCLRMRWSCSTSSLTSVLMKYFLSIDIIILAPLLPGESMSSGGLVKEFWEKKNQNHIRR